MHNSDLREFQTGIQVLAKLASGNVNLVLDGTNISGSVLKNTPGAKYIM
jgi:ABC-type taurine transport system substrate-binding protein